MNLSSIFGMVAMPTQSVHNASKFAVRGYTEALRMGLELAGAPVGVTCVHPGGIAIARSQRIDPAVQDFTGESEDAFRRRAARDSELRGNALRRRNEAHTIERALLDVEQLHAGAIFVREVHHRGKVGHRPWIGETAKAARNGPGVGLLEFQLARGTERDVEDPLIAE